VQGEEALGATAKQLQLARVRVHQQVFAQAGQAPIPGEFLAPVIRLGGRREHLHHHRRRPKEVLGAQVGRIAGDEDIGVEQHIVGHLQLHALAEGAAGAALELLPERGRNIERHQPMHTPRAHHGKDLAAHELVPLGLGFFPGQKVLQAENRLRMSHGRILASARAAGAGPPSGDNPPHALLCPV
jgi:hypothetical protein